MVVNLQFFGGRGSSSGLKKNQIAGADVTYDGSTMRIFFENHNGKWYRQHDFGGIPEETPNNMSPKEYIERATKNGAKVQIISEKQKVEYKKAYDEDRKKTNEFLNREEFKAWGRRDAIKGNRALRRKK